MEVTVSSKGQISLPVDLRRALDIRRGDRLALELQADGTVLMRRREVSNARSLIGAWRDLVDRYGDVDQMINELRGPVED